MTAPGPRCAPLGDRAVTLILGDRVDPALNARVRAVAASLQHDWPSGVLDVVPSFATLAVYYDPLVLDYEPLAADLLRRAAAAGGAEDPPPGRELVLPVRYDGPDLTEVAERTGLTTAEVIRRHAGRSYRVYFLGFVPGFAFLGELDPALELPRRSAPRQRVPAGSVAIAGRQTGVYPLDTPGGWHLLGRTDVALFDPAREPATLLSVGDRVRFEPVP